MIFTEKLYRVAAPFLKKFLKTLIQTKSKPFDIFLPLKYTPLIEDFLGKEKFISMPRTRLRPKERKKEIRKEPRSEIAVPV